MPQSYTGTAYKWANSEDEALKCLATKAGRVEKKTNSIIDKHNSTLTIISINEEK